MPNTMKRQLQKAQKADFGTEVSKILPLIMREVTKRQMSILSKGFLTIPQVVILDLLVERGPCRMSELARVLGFTMSAVTAIVDKMISLRLVKRERSSQDRRVVKVIILNKGKETAGRVSEERRDVANNIFSALTEEDRNEYLRLLRKVYDNLRQRQRQR